MRLVVVGIGPHARTFYLPALHELQAVGKVKVVALVDLEPQRTAIEAWCVARGIAWKRYYLAPFSEQIPEDAEARLAALLDETPADGVIISTDPLAHKCYALWAMRAGLHILLDKPVSSAKNAVSCMAAAGSIESDYEDLASARARLHGERAFILCAHRRYHPGFDAALDLVRQVSQETGCPVTHQHAYHSDGQWRLPEEILTQDHHSYNQGHGKLSHSGFHFIDTLYRFRQAGNVPGKQPDEVEVNACFLQPNGFLEQITRADYLSLFGDDYQCTASTPDAYLREKFSRFGELDLEVTLGFRRMGHVFSLASASLHHGGFSRRSWLMPGKDLYKGNGRVKHEQHRIHVGPFLGLQIHSCQAKDRHDKFGGGEYELGGNNHFEIWVFRNSGMIGGVPVERISFSEIQADGEFQCNRLVIEQVKRRAILEFLDRAAGRKAASDLRSDFSDHRLPVRLMSAIYRSHVAKSINGNPLVIIPWQPL